MFCGLFVGGKATRMGGRAKGLLPTESGEPVVVRLARLAAELGLTPVYVGVRESPHEAAYRAALPALDAIDDAPRGIGPLGGLAGLLAASSGPVIALACDMPRVSAAVLRRLVEEQPEAAVLAARGSLWEPLFARYAVAVSPLVQGSIARGTRSFQRLFAELPVVELALDASERASLLDWDKPEDLR